MVSALSRWWTLRRICPDGRGENATTAHVAARRGERQQLLFEVIPNGLEK
jgi:hypothetical protein